MNAIQPRKKITHMLSTSLNTELSDAEKQDIKLAIYDVLNNISIEKTIFNVSVSITWRVTNETDLLHYYTNCGGMLGDAVVKEHTKMVLSDIKKIVSDKSFSLELTRNSVIALL
jgi:hypothetical protein